MLCLQRAPQANERPKCKCFLLYSAGKCIQAAVKNPQSLSTQIDTLKITLEATCCKNLCWRWKGGWLTIRKKHLKTMKQHNKVKSGPIGTSKFAYSVISAIFNLSFSQNQRRTLEYTPVALRDFSLTVLFPLNLLSVVWKKWSMSLSSLPVNLWWASRTVH